MELLAIIVGILGNFISLTVFASPLPTFWCIIKKRCTEGFSAVPYMVCLLSQAIWVYYGVLNPKGLLVVTISAIGCAFEMFYLTIYVLFTSNPKRISTVRLFSFCVLVFSALFISTLLGAHGHRRLIIVGFICAINSVCMFAAPLGVMKQVVTTKSVEYMPLFLSISLCLCGGTWATYGLLVWDPFIGVPNGIGFLLGTAQLIIYVIYYKCKPPEAGKLANDGKKRPNEIVSKMQDEENKCIGV